MANAAGRKLTAKKKKLIIIISAVVAVIAAAAIIISSNYAYFYTRAMYLIMPKSVVTQTTDGDMEFFVRLSDETDSKVLKNDPMKAFELYYYDEGGNEVPAVSVSLLTDADSDDGKTDDESEDETDVSLLFLLKLMQKYSKIKSAAATAGWILAAAAAVAAIVVWFLMWSKKQDREKKEKYGHKKKAKKKSNCYSYRQAVC